jgi:hypothetical protein
MTFESVIIAGILIIIALVMVYKKLTNPTNQTFILIELLKKKTLLRDLWFKGFEVVEIPPLDGVRRFGLKHINESMAYVPPIDILMPRLLTDDIDEVFHDCIMKGEEYQPTNFRVINVRALNPMDYTYE